MDLINDTTGERAPGHRVGTDERGDVLYRVPEGWTPVEPYWLDAEGYAHEGVCSRARLEELTDDCDDPPAQRRAGGAK